MSEEFRWWQRGVVYQVYPRSFQDSDGDGVGDLRGVRRRLDHLEWLGIDAVWLSPIYPSPMADFGYDVADYLNVDPLFGKLSDLDELIADLHARGMRLLLDFVPNHTSDRHPWFVESRSSRDNPRRDWYIWRDPAPDGGPPNGWQSAFLGSAWEPDERTGQYYFHSFLKEQPDLDWTNPAVREAMADVLRFWFRRGVDGFRIDVINLLAKRRELAPGRPRSSGRQVWGDERRIHDLVAELRRVADEFEDRVLVGEIWLPLAKLVAYYGSDLRGLHLPFNFQLLQLPWSAKRIGAAIERYEALLPPGAWPNWVLGNHDRPRIATRVGAAQARVAAVLLLALRGTPTIYYGDEIGMSNVVVPADVQRDPQGLRGGQSRDPCRTPMRWDGGPTAGFTTGQPWLPVGPGVSTINAAAERDEPDSMLNLYRRLLALRRQRPALSIGGFGSLAAQGKTLGFVRSHRGEALLIVLNLSTKPSRFATEHGGRVILSTHPDRDGVTVGRSVDLMPDEALVVEISSAPGRRG